MNTDHFRAAYRWYREATILLSKEKTEEFDNEVVDRIRTKRRKKKKASKGPYTPLEYVEAAAETYQNTVALFNFPEIPW